MPSELFGIKKRQAQQVIMLHGLFFIMLAILSLIWLSYQNSIVFLIGAMVIISANFVFAQRLFSVRQVRSPSKLLKVVIMAEFWKFLTIIILVIAAIKWMPFMTIYFIIGIVMAEVTFLFLSLLMTKNSFEI